MRRSFYYCRLAAHFVSGIARKTDLNELRSSMGLLILKIHDPSVCGWLARQLQISDGRMSTSSNPNKPIEKTVKFRGRVWPEGAPSFALLREWYSHIPISSI